MAVEKRDWSWDFYSGSFFNYEGWKEILPVVSGRKWRDLPVEPEGPKEATMAELGLLVRAHDWPGIMKFACDLHEVDHDEFYAIYYKLAKTVGSTKAAWNKIPLTYHTEALFRFVSHTERRLSLANASAPEGRQVQDS